MKTALLFVFATWVFLASVKTLPHVLFAFASETSECHPCAELWCNNLEAYRSCVNDQCMILADIEYQFYRFGSCPGNDQTSEVLHTGAPSDPTELIDFYLEDECEPEFDEAPQPTPVHHTWLDSVDGVTEVTPVRHTTVPTTVDSLDQFMSVPFPEPTGTAFNKRRNAPARDEIVDALAGVIELVNAATIEHHQIDGTAASALGDIGRVVSAIHNATTSTHPDGPGAIPSALGEIGRVAAAIHNATDSAAAAALGEIAHNVSVIDNATQAAGHHGMHVSNAEHSYVPDVFAPPAIVAYLAVVLAVV